MDSPRKTALVAGLLYLLTFVSIPTPALYGPVRDRNHVTGPGPDTAVIVGGILEVVVAFAGVGTAVVLFPILKRQNESAALGFVGARTLEGAAIVAGVACLPTVVTVRRTGAGADAVVGGQVPVALYDRLFLLGQSLMPVVNALLLGSLRYRARLVPRALPVLGFIGAHCCSRPRSRRWPAPSSGTRRWSPSPRCRSRCGVLAGDLAGGQGFQAVTPHVRGGGGVTATARVVSLWP
ncbi:MAG: hypothetical protein QOI78_194 [Actinomycetota bacterium]|jgi:hypothetical protein|nr:hypothetical protein [Actinomycetota bacterium]